MTEKDESEDWEQASGLVCDWSMWRIIEETRDECRFCERCKKEVWQICERSGCKDNGASIEKVWIEWEIWIKLIGEVWVDWENHVDWESLNELSWLRKSELIEEAIGVKWIEKNLK